MSFKFEPGSAVAIHSGGTSTTLAAAAGIISNATYDNSNTSNYYFWAALEFVGSWASAPTAASTIEIYLVPALDGTNYADLSNTTPNPNQLRAVLPVQGVTGAQRIVVDDVKLAPYLYKAYIRNQTNQTISAGWSVNIYPYREQ